MGHKKSKTTTKGRILRISTLQSGWCDKDYVLLHAAFQILVDFVEQEKPDKIVDWSWDAPHRKAWREISDLYTWWKKIRPKRKSKYAKAKLPPKKWVKVAPNALQWVSLDPVADRKFAAIAKKQIREEEKWDQEDQRQLHRLVAVRRFLWT